jgi:hypothetical protein
MVNALVLHRSHPNDCDVLVQLVRRAGPVGTRYALVRAGRRRTFLSSPG